MSSKETLGAQDEMRETVEGDQDQGNRQAGDNSLAKKLSNELDNWRRQRNGSKPKQHENHSVSNPQSSGPARTIKVRGHETLVVRRPKLMPKSESDGAPDKN